MGRRRRNEDTTQVGNIDQTIDSQDNQLQSVPVSAETLNPTETKSSINQENIIPYEDRPIPEAYFPPEDEEPAQEFMPEPNIQLTPSTPKYKIVSKKELDALKFVEKQTEAKTENTTPTATKTEVEKPVVAPKNIDLSTLQFEPKQTISNTTQPTQSENIQAETNVDAKENTVATSNVSVPTLTINVDKYISKKDSNNTLANGNSLVVDPASTYPDSILTATDSITKDSLAVDSFTFTHSPKVEPKREIIAIDGKEMPDTINNTWWFTPILLLLFLAYSVIIRDRKKAIFSELQSFIKPTTDGSIFGFQWLQNSKYKFFLSALGIVSVSLYLFLANSMSISSIWIFFLAVVIFVVGKNMMLSLLEYIYFQGADVASMSEAFMVMVRQAGLMITPAVLGLCFAPESYRTFFIYFGGFVIGIAILAFNIKLILNFLRGITSIFYLILYLCTLEVIPVAIFFVLGLLPIV